MLSGNFQSTGEGQLRWYTLMPGDGTQYRFGFMRLDDNFRRDCGSRLKMFPGTSHYHVLVVVAMYPKSGCYELSMRTLREIKEDHSLAPGEASYLAGHAGCDKYTALAVVLALTVLIDDPYNVADACEAMLEAEELRHEME